MRLPNCILCRSSFDESKVKPEHVLLNSLGGRMTVENVICSSCNQLMGNGPDEDLAKSVEGLRNYGNLKAGDGDDAPKIIGYRTKNQRFDLLPGGRPEIRPIRPLKFKEGEGGTVVEINASDDKHADLLAHGAAKKLAKKFGRNDEVSVADLREQINSAKRHSLMEPPEIQIRTEIGGYRSQQAMAKATLVLWAKLVGNTEVLERGYDSIRQFIWQQESTSGIEAPTKFDARPLPSFNEIYGSCPCIVWAGSDSKGRVFGYFRLYGMLGWRIDLGHSLDVIDRAICLISNPFNPSSWKLYTEESQPLESTWILIDWDNYTAENDTRLDGVTKLMCELRTRSNELFVDNLVSEALSESGLTVGQIITAQHISFISNFIAKRLVITRLQVERAV
ncbi:HNH endonuclease [Falsihalocynthiibacter sp. S25ZX9]|uniref:HNH endonuclease n=1 Tax=Falsihalocynthiibacter sp. S25ZX9 TaxID=3240870 RepID=UPI00351033D4